MKNYSYKDTKATVVKTHNCTDTKTIVVQI